MRLHGQPVRDLAGAVKDRMAKHYERRAVGMGNKFSAAGDVVGALAVL